ncbi:MAG TPA: MFS transporter [Candidatus Saccharimonadales bacterium]|nr:MFS transporter [Candidatus Saccharimonadales bacterium]
MLGKVKHKGLALAVLAAAQFIVVLDATIVNVALPAIQKALGFTTDAQLQWVVTAYALTFGGFLLLGGRLADMFGRRKMLVAGIVIFAIASLLAGIAQDPTQMIITRGLQGVGGALLAPAGLSLILTIFKEGAERNKAFGVFSMVAAGGGAVGLVLGGLLTQYVDWRWIFFINVPLSALIIAAAFKYIPASEPVERQRIDYVGALTITGSLMALVYALAKAAEDGWGAGITITMFILAAALMAVFILNELWIKRPLIKLSIFKRRNVTGGNIIQLLMPAAMFGMFFYLSIYLQTILQYSPVKTGLANLPFTLTVIVVAGYLSRNIAKFNPKVILSVAPLMVAGALLWFARIPVDGQYLTDVLPGIVIMAAGMAMVFVTTTMVTTSGVSHEDSGLVSGLLNTGQQVGGAIGLAVLTVVSSAVIKSDMIAAQGNQAALPAAMVHGFQHGFIAAAIFAAAASVAAITILKVHKPTKKDLANISETEAEAMPAIPGV